MEFFIPLSVLIFGSTVFFAKNPVYGVLSFVIVIAHVVLILIALYLEFFAYVLAIVYIGAIVVLFLFVIMMFILRQSSTAYRIRGLILFVLAGVSVALLNGLYTYYSIHEYTEFSLLILSKENSRIIAYFLFNDWILLTFLAALIMFVGVIGPIVLTIKNTANSPVIKVRSKVQESIIKTV